MLYSQRKESVLQAFNVIQLNNKYNCLMLNVQNMKIHAITMKNYLQNRFLRFYLHIAPPRVSGGNTDYNMNNKN